MTGPAQARSALADAYLVMWPISGPWTPCKAPPGSPCGSASGERLPDIHPLRADAIFVHANRPIPSTEGT